MENTNKYYTPEIEEFHVGFEFELLTDIVKYDKQWRFKVKDKDWTARTFTKSDFSRGKGWETYEDLNESWIRVKCFDKEDIESLGWKCIGELEYEFYSTPRYATWKLKIYIDKLSITFYHPDDSKGGLWFFGTIKNKSEFKQVLKMLGIK